MCFNNAGHRQLSGLDGLVKRQRFLFRADVQLVGQDPLAATGANLGATVDALRRLGTLVTPDRPALVVGLLYDMATGLVRVTDDAGLGVTA